MSQNTVVPLLNDFSDKKYPEFRHARSTTLLENYDPAAYPPDLQFAEQHGLAKRVGEYVPPLEDTLRCRCCLEPVHKKQLPLSADLINLFHLGTSTPLYFQFLKQCLFLLAVNIFCMTLPALLINLLKGEQCGTIEGGAEGILNSICRGSIINVMNVDQLEGMQMLSGFFFIGVVTNILLVGYLELRMDLLIEKYQQGRLKAVNYSLMVKGLPSDITISQIQKYVQDKMLYSGAPDLTINKIYIIYNFKNYLTLVQKRQDLTEKMITLSCQIKDLNTRNLATTEYSKKIDIQKKANSKETELKKCQREIQQLSEELDQFQVTSEAIRRRIALGGVVEDDTTKKVMNFSGKVIVTVNNRRSQKKVLQKHDKMGCWQRISYSISELLQGKKSKVVVSRAPDPEDIIFSNMGSKPTTVWKSRLLYSVLIFFLLCLDFLIVTLARKFLKEEKALQNGNIIFSFLNSIIISLFCSLFRRIVNKSEDESYYTTESRRGYKIVFKVVLVFMINMLFTTLMANAVSFYLIKEDKPTFEGFPLNFESFVYDCFFLMATNPVFAIFLVIFDHRQLRSRIKQSLIKRGYSPVSQGEANQSFQNMHFDLCYKYSTVYRFLIFSAGIAIFYPLSFFICFLSILALYWFDKYFLLRRYSVVLKMNSRFTKMTHKLLSQVPIYLSLTTFIVMFIPVQEGSAFEELDYSKTYYYFSAVAVGLSLANYLVGSSWIKSGFRIVFKLRDREEEEDFPEYRYIQNSLESDYSHNYPYFRVTKTIDREQKQQVRVQKVRELRQNQKLDTFDLIKHYMSQKRYDE